MSYLNQVVSSYIDDCVETLQNLPTDWRFTPIWDGKKPLRQGWQTNPLTAEEVIQSLSAKGVTGYGLVTRNGLLAIDLDGPSALPILEVISHAYAGKDLSESLPETVSWTSGKEGRKQLLFRIPEGELPGFQRKPVKDFNGIKCAPGEQVEFRGTGHQSVLPPSYRPDLERCYTWITKPLSDGSNVAEAPEWLIRFLNSLTEPEAPTLKPVEHDLNHAGEMQEYTSQWMRKKLGDEEAVGDEAPASDGVELGEKFGLLSPSQQNYLYTALNNEYSRLTQAKELRNDELNKAAYNLGKYVKAGLSKQAIVDTLLAACKSNGYLAKDGEKATLETIDSGIKGGMKKPKPIPELKGDSSDSSSGGGSGGKKPTQLQLIEILEAEYASRLSFNTLGLEIYLDEEPLQSTTTILIEITKNHELGFSPAMLDLLVLEYAKRNSFSPVQRYFESLEWDGVERIKRFAATLGDNPIYLVYIEKWLISAAARVYKPGCKADNMLVLQGPQGFRKTSFFQWLSGDWYIDLGDGDIDNKDWLLNLHKGLICELGEIDHVMGKKANSQIKRVITMSTDVLRPPFGKKTEAFPRASVFCATTNEQEFLSDLSGDRRYWVIPLTQKIDLTHWLHERDQFWAEAVYKFKELMEGDLTREPIEQEYLWWLSDEEDEIRKQANKQFAVGDPWEQYLYEAIRRAWLKAGRNAAQPSERYVTASEVLWGLEVEPSQQSKGLEMRAAKVLTAAGFNKGKRMRTKGGLVVPWYFPNHDKPDFDMNRDLFGSPPPKADW